MPLSQTSSLDTQGAIIVAGEGTAGSAAGGVLSVQGVTSGMPLIVTSKSITPASPTTSTVGITSASSLAANSNRKGLVIVNVSINTVSFGLGAAAVLNSGITLYPGGTWTMDDYTYTTVAINAIASAASSVISIQEFS